MSITLYDFPASVPGGTLSRNTIKTRLALSFKGLSFKTEWLELSEIESKMKEIGADPTSKSTAGRPLYTLPVIHDLTTGRIISDSMQIAFYLEDAYPDMPTLFPHDLRAPVVMFDSYFFPTVFRPGADIVNHAAFNKLSPASIAYIRERHGGAYLERISQLSIPGNPQRDALWSAIRDGFLEVSRVLTTNGEGSPFYCGKTMSFADLILVAHLLWMKASLGIESEEWKEVETWEGGRWAWLLNETASLQTWN